MFASNRFSNLGLDLDVAVGDPITTCTQDGPGIMVRKDSKLPDWWNPAFDQLKMTSGYEKICTSYAELHGE